jgi:hypothetical protein
MSLYKGRGVRLEVALTFDAADVVTAITLANPGVVSAAAHGWASGDYGYVEETGNGMAQIDGQAIRAANVAAGTLETEGLDTTTYGAFVSGNIYRAASWATLSNATDFTIGGGEADKLDATTLLDFIKKEENGLLAAETVNINMFADPLSSAVARVRALALSKGGSGQQANRSLFRITYPSSALEIFWFGEPSVPGFSQQKQQIATGSLQVTCRGFMMYL